MDVLPGMEHIHAVAVGAPALPRLAVENAIEEEFLDRGKYPFVREEARRPAPTSRAAFKVQKSFADLQSEIALGSWQSMMSSFAAIVLRTRYLSSN